MQKVVDLMSLESQLISMTESLMEQDKEKIG